MVPQSSLLNRSLKNLIQYISLLWITTIVSIILSTFRAMNFGYQMQTYAISAICNIIFIWHAYKNGDKRMMTMYSFYLITAFIAVSRWY
jgi:hypothetical protein